MNLTYFSRIAAAVLSAVIFNNAAADTTRLVSDLSPNASSATLLTNGGESTDLSLSLHEIAVSTEELDGILYTNIRLPETEYTSPSEFAEPGFPSLPYLTSLLAVPDQCGIELSVEYSGFDIYDDIDLVPVQPSPSESEYEELPFTKNDEIYATDSFLPGQLATAADPVIMRDVRMVQISIYPAQYSPVRRQLKVYRDIFVSVSYTDNNVINPKTNRRPYLSDAFYPIYKSILPNFDQFYAAADVKRGGYMIIAKDLLIDSLGSVAEWKHQKGYTVYMVPATEISSNGNPTQYQIRNYVQDAYSTWEIPPEYVLIVGDMDNLGYSGITDFPFNYYTSDHPYSMVEGSDYLPDIFIGRLSIDNMSQLRVAAAKILAYEKTPQMEEPEKWLRGLSIGGNVYAVTPRLTVLWVRQLLMRNGFAQVDTSFRWQSGQVDPYLIDYFNAGPSIISYRGWSGPSGWYCPSFNSTNLYQMQNSNRLGVIASVACATGDFAPDECFGERWIRMGASPQTFKGGPGFFGSSDHNGHTRWHNPIMVGYYWGIFNDNIYHFGPAGARGKLQLYRTFPDYTNPGQTVEKYFHTFNILGDPELELRTAIPVQLSVEYPDAIPLGMNYALIRVEDGSGAPVEDAVATLVKESDGIEEVFEVGKTDASGNIVFSFDALTTGEMLLTVSGRNLYPFQENISIYENEIAVGFDSAAVDDDMFGYSRGNNDGQANPAEILELSITLENFGTDLIAENVDASIVALDSGKAVVLDGFRHFGDIPPGESANSDAPYVLAVNHSARNTEIIRLKVIASDQNENSWESILEIPVEAPALHVSAVTIFDNNNRLDPGETAQMVLTLTNSGSAEASDVTGTISTFDDYTAVIESDGVFGDIPVNGSANNFDFPMTVSSSAETFQGRNLNFVLRAVDESGAEFNMPFSLVVGEVNSDDPVGPDNYGYYMYDDIDEAYDPNPQYEWIDILPNHGGGGEIIVFDNLDDDSQMITLPFDFVYYGETYRYIIVSIDGFIAPDTTRYDMDGNFWSTFFNWSIPDPGNARAQISPFWDDLSYTGGNYGVYTFYDNDHHRFIIEWNYMDHRNTNSFETFELIISDPAYYPTITGDSEILFQYYDVTNDDVNENYATVGFENFAETIGLEYTFDNRDHPAAAGLADGRAVLITTNTGRGGLRGNINLPDNEPGNPATVATSTGQSRIASSTGDYWIRNIPPGDIAAFVSAPGYFPQEASLVISVNTTLENQDFDMSLCPIPTDLSASEGLGDRIELTWNEIEHQDLTGYNVFRGRWQNGDFERLNTVPVSGNSFTDYAVPDSGTYWYCLTAAFNNDIGAAESFKSAKDAGSLDVITGTDNDAPIIPDRLFISQNYPNPFNQNTVINFGLPVSGTVNIEIYDILGRRVETLIDKELPAGYHALTWRADNLPSGVYFARLQAGESSDTVKMVLMK